MTAESIASELEKVIKLTAAAFAAEAVPSLLAVLDARRTEKQPDPLLTTKEVAARLGVSESKVRELVSGGYLQRAKGMSEIRVRQSVVDAYGTKP